MTQYARGTRAFGFCERCGRRWPLNDLAYQVIATRTTRMRVCSGCLDEDHPQLMSGRVKVQEGRLWISRPPNEIETGMFVVLEEVPGTPIQTHLGTPIHVLVS